MTLDALLPLLLTATHLLLAGAGAGHALLYKRDPRAAVAWVVLCVMLPLAGPIAYFLFGINRVRTRARLYHSHRGPVGFERAERRLPTGEEPPHSPLASVGASISSHRLLEGNAVEPLYNGDATYAAMLEAIAGAARSVYLSTYIFETGAIGRRFVAALAAARERGVDVRVLIDGVGQHYSWPTATRLLRRAGVPVQRFLPLRLIPPAIHLNLRNHRKILAVDGDVAFTGGINIGERHVARPDGSFAVTDVHFRLRGPIVAGLEKAFCQDWYFVTRQKLPMSDEPEAAGSTGCRLILDDPGENLDRMAMVIQGAVGAASRQVDIMTPYFLPSREMVAALQAASSRGVRVRIVLPAKNNLPFVHWATRNMLWELLMWDVAIVYQAPPFCHSKLFLVDDEYGLIGSANLDPRSLRLNFELGVEIFDQDFVSQVRDHIDATCAAAHRVTLEEMDRRPLWQRLRDAFFWLFSPYL